MPDSRWPSTPLIELTNNFDSVRVPVKESERKPGKFPYYGASGVVDHVDGFLFDGEYLLIAEDGENLRTRQTPIAFMATGKFWVNNHAHIVQGNDRALTRYLAYALSQTEIGGFLSGSTMPKLTQGNMNRIPVIEPPLAEQKAIAHILGTLDDKIDLNRRMNATLEAMARALFQSWFVDFDPVRAKLDGRRPPNPDPATAALFPDHFHDSPLGPIPRGWETGRLGQYLETAIGGDWGEDDRFDGAVEVAALRGVDLEHLRERGDANAPRRWIKEVSLTKRRMSACDILVASSGAGPCGRPLWVSPHLEAAFPVPVLYSNFCKRYRAASPAHALYFDRLLFEMRESGEIWDFINGTSLPNLDSNGLMTGKSVLVPPVEILKQFATFVEPIYKHLYSGESRTLATLRDTLLPKLLSGAFMAKTGQQKVSV